MNDQEKDNIFGEVGVDLGFITPADISQALENQKVDEAIGARKPIGAYLFDAGKLNKDQIGKIVVIQEKLIAKTAEQQAKDPLPVTPVTVAPVTSSSLTSTIFAFGFILLAGFIFTASKGKLALISGIMCIYSFFGHREKGWFKSVGLVMFFCV